MIGWTYFPDGGGPAMGVNDAGIQTFKGDTDWSLAREILQNSVDAHARLAKEPVVVEFQLMDLKRDEIPGIEELTKTLQSCQAFWPEDPKAQKFFLRAAKLAAEKRIPVLRVGDYNTTGVTGTDSDKSGNWYKLVRSSGSSSKIGGEGGSYGIGKNAPFAASPMQTVLYSTRTSRDGVAFQGVARLVTHDRKKIGTVQPTSYLCGSGGASVRRQNDVPSSFRRDKLGTDVFILGYQGTAGWADIIARDVLDNFWPAIHYGMLEVRVSGTNINKKNLPALLDRYSSDSKFKAHLYHRAFTSKDSQKTERELQTLKKAGVWLLPGEDDLPNKVAMIRKSGMVIYPRPFHSVTPYCGIFECKNDTGNQILRSMEPPKHDIWDEDQPEPGQNRKAHSEITKFVRECVSQLTRAAPGDVLDVPDLAAFLPDDDDTATETFDQESDKGGGKGETFNRKLPPKKLPVKVAVHAEHSSRAKADEGDEEEDPETGKHGDGKDGTGGKSGSKRTPGDRARIEPPPRFRVIPIDSDGRYRVVVSSEGGSRKRARILLNAVGDDGRRLPLEVATARIEGGAKVAVRGGTEIGPIEFGPKSPVRLDVLVRVPDRLAIEVEAYEA